MFKQIFAKNKLLLPLLLAVFFKQLVWIAFIPLWQFPDEQAHFGQIAYSVELGKVQPGKNLSKEILEAERILQTERNWAGNNKFTYHPEYNIPYTDSFIGRHEEEIKNFPIGERQIMVKMESTYYPPLYYFPASIVYRLFYHSDLFVRVFSARFINIIYSILTAFIAYKLFYLVFENYYLATLGAVFLIFQPMFSFTQGGVNSDNLFNLLFTWAIFISLLSIKKGLKARETVLAIFIFLLAIYTKPQSYLIILIYTYPFIYHILKNKKFRKIGIILFVLVACPSILLRILKGRQWLPEVYPEERIMKDLTFAEHLWWSLKHTYREVLPWYWGVFRWLSLALPKLVNRVINRVLLILGVGVILYLVRVIKKRDFSFKTISLGFFFYVSFVYFGIITFWDYLFKITHGFSFGIQGRYFLPAISAHMGILIFGIVGFTLKEKIRKILALVLVAGMIVLHEIALFWVLFSYFSRRTIAEFFLQASQYKPWFFKSPTLEFIILVHFVTLVYFSFKLITVKFIHAKAKT